LIFRKLIPVLIVTKCFGKAQFFWQIGEKAGNEHEKRMKWPVV